MLEGSIERNFLLLNFYRNFFADLKKIFNFAAEIKTKKKMATPIKIIPTVTGESARAFLERAEERERNPHRTILFTEDEERAYINMLKRSGML